MKWYDGLQKIAASAKPPAYMIERISDLKHACHLLPISPRDGRKVISEVITKLNQHHNNIFSAPLIEASKISMDSPSRAVVAVEKVIKAMHDEKELMEIEKEDRKWK